MHFIRKGRCGRKTIWRNYSWILFKNIKCPAGDITRADNGNFKYATNPANQSAVLLGPAKSMTDATILAKVKLDNTMYDVTSIARNAFKETNLSSVTFREGIKTICDSAFYSNALTSVEFPASLTTIKNGAFQRNKIKIHNLWGELDFNRGMRF